jgi:hypothetical protein
MRNNENIKKVDVFASGSFERLFSSLSSRRRTRKPPTSAAAFIFESLAEPQTKTMAAL